MKSVLRATSLFTTVVTTLLLGGLFVWGDIISPKTFKVLLFSTLALSTLSGILLFVAKFVKANSSIEK